MMRDGTLVVRQALLILLAALIPASLTAAFHPLRPPWSQETLAPGEELLPTVLGWGENVLWVDARSADEYGAEHVPGRDTAESGKLGPVVSQFS